MPVCKRGHQISGTNIVLSKKHDKPLCRICLEAMQAKQRETSRVKGVHPKRQKSTTHPWATTVITGRHRFISSQVNATLLKAARLPSPVSVYRMDEQGNKVFVRMENSRKH